MQTSTTVGFGDITLEKRGSRVLMIFYMPIMVVSFGYGLGLIASAKAVHSFTLKRLQKLAIDRDD